MYIYTCASGSLPHGEGRGTGRRYTGVSVPTNQRQLADRWNTPLVAAPR